MVGVFFFPPWAVVLGGAAGALGGAVEALLPLCLFVVFLVVLAMTEG